MAMTSETVARAVEYAQRIRDMGKPATVVALRLLANGYEAGDRRSSNISLHAVDTVNASGARTITVWHEGWGDVHNATYIIDDGTTTEAFYVAGWHPTSGEVHLTPFPTGEDFQFSTWQIPARRAYHVKLGRRIPALAEFNGTPVVSVAALPPF